ncbi:MAG: hypothetical protein LBR06_07850 [Bacteroidales bacterium]|jgi:F-type H+-transporting ATPase subunit epsilon|nr:hypothetical protein [Bacteroidales bacterium]
MHIEVITPAKKLFDGDADAVKLPGSQSPFEVLKNHAPLISSLEKGTVSIIADGQTTAIPINGGFVQVVGNHIVVLASGEEITT